MPGNRAPSRPPFRALLRKATDPIYDAKRWARYQTAAVWRRQCANTVFVGITGSHGKTTATALLGELLAMHAPTYVRMFDSLAKTAARTILRVRPWHHRFCVQEVGLDVPGSVEQTVGCLRPSVGIVTAIGGDHRRAFGGSKEAIAAEKAKLVHRLPADGLAVLNADDPLVAAMADGCLCRVVYHGRAESADLRLLDASSAWPRRLQLEVAYRGERFTVRTRLVGTHWVVSVMAALLTALELGASRSECLAAVERFEPVFERMSVHRTPQGAWYILDTNKSSYFGIEACLDFLNHASVPRKTVIFGTISDYPGASRSHYYQVARMALGSADRVFFTGPNAGRVRRLAAGEFAGRLFAVERPEEIVQTLAGDAVADEIIYVKATMADRLPRVFVPAS